MARGIRARHRLASHKYRSAPYPSRSCHREVLEKESDQKKCPKILERKDWEDATCSVCMEYPHNAVLLLCSSYDKGCRPYMCATSYRYSNCLDQFKKAGSIREIMELVCPLCRGLVKGWTIVEPAREYLDTKKRSCMQDGCLFIGTYKELRKHMRAEHPFVRPREVDPIYEQKWRRLENERERNDAISTIRSSMPGARIIGDYAIGESVIEGNPPGFEMGDFDDSDEGNGSYDAGRRFNLIELLDILGTAMRLGRDFHDILGEYERGARV